MLSRIMSGPGVGRSTSSDNTKAEKGGVSSQPKRRNSGLTTSPCKVVVTAT